MTARKQLSAEDEQLITDVEDLLSEAAAAEKPRVQITKPGVYDLDDATYHADPVPGGSLSHSGAVTLTEPAGAAKFRYAVDNPAEAEDKDHFDFGKAAHTTVLTDGAGIAEIPYDNRRTNECKAKIANARAEGKIPVLTKDLDRVNRMAEKLKDHTAAHRLLSSGRPEASVFAFDAISNLMLRARFDVLRSSVPGQRLIIPDYKSAAAADNESFEKAAYNNGYLIQADWYPRVAVLLGLADEAVMAFVAQEKTPPYLVNVVQLTTLALEYGRTKSDEAIATYLRCRKSGHWPGYGDDINLIGLPRWAERDFLESR